MIPPVCYWDKQYASELKAAGEQYLQYFTNVCGLRPEARVLDVGCAIGRIAAPLTHYLNNFGSYEGLDIIPEAIRWCDAKIASSFPNFHFQLADVMSKEYNPKGAFEASEYVFPFSDESFDFVFLGSVFTHMLPGGVERYLSEIARVLKVGGKSLITYFLLTPKTRDSIERGESTLPFTYDGRGFKAVSETLPEMAVAYDEFYVRGLYEQNSLTIVEPVRYGTWPRFVPTDMFGKKVGDFEYQDFVIAQKEAPN
jgi:SAM-dependent methyltransferase